MSLSLVRALLTLALFVAFVALVFWAWSRHRKVDFEAAARLPLEEGEAPPAAARASSAGQPGPDPRPIEESKRS